MSSFSRRFHLVIKTRYTGYWKVHHSDPLPLFNCISVWYDDLWVKTHEKIIHSWTGKGIISQILKDEIKAQFIQYLHQPCDLPRMKTTPVYPAKKSAKFIEEAQTKWRKRRRNRAKRQHRSRTETKSRKRHETWKNQYLKFDCPWLSAATVNPGFQLATDLW